MTYTDNNTAVIAKDGTKYQVGKPYPLPVPEGISKHSIVFNFGGIWSFMCRPENTHWLVLPPVPVETQEEKDERAFVEAWKKPAPGVGAEYEYAGHFFRAGVAHGRGGK